MNASLVRRVILSRLFYNQNYFYFIPLRNLLFATYLAYYLSLLSPYTGKMVLPIFYKSSQTFWQLQVYIFTSMHLNEL
jgi:hypothetical protein